MAGKHVRTVIKKGLQTYAGVNAQGKQRVAISIAHQVIHIFDACAGMHFTCPCESTCLGLEPQVTIIGIGTV